MGVLRARKIEQTTASESRSDYLLEITFLFPLSLVAAEGNREKRGGYRGREKREAESTRMLLNIEAMYASWVRNLSG